MNTPTLTAETKASIADRALEIGAPLLPESSPYQRRILFALPLLGKHVYAGTVPAAVKSARRQKNKAARIARRQNRSSK